MREILFKAKRIDNGEWVYGFYALIGIKEVIIQNKSEKYYCTDNGKNSRGNEILEVDPSTICQYTGLIDKNGQKIWENDVAYMRCNGLSGYGNVIYENGCFWIDDKKRGRKYPFSNHDVKYRVDGNIFDNPKLLNE